MRRLRDIGAGREEAGRCRWGALLTGGGRDLTRLAGLLHRSQSP